MTSALLQGDAEALQQYLLSVFDPIQAELLLLAAIGAKAPPENINLILDRLLGFQPTPADVLIRALLPDYPELAIKLAQGTNSDIEMYVWRYIRDNFSKLKDKDWIKLIPILIDTQDGQALIWLVHIVAEHGDNPQTLEYLLETPRLHDYIAAHLNKLIYAAITEGHILNASILLNQPGVDIVAALGPLARQATTSSTFDDLLLRLVSIYPQEAWQALIKAVNEEEFLAAYELLQKLDPPRAQEINQQITYRSL